MKNILYVVFSLFVLLSVGIPDTGQDHKSYSDNYSLVSENTENLEKDDAQSDYEDAMNLTSLSSCLLLDNIKATDTREQFSYDGICKIFQPPR